MSGKVLTHHGWVATPYPTGTFTLQETPSLSWRDNALLKLSALDYAGTLNVAGQQALSRAAFGQRLLAWWGINTQGHLQEAQAAEMTDTIPLDLRLTLTKAEHLLEMSFAGVDEVFARQRG